MNASCNDPGTGYVPWPGSRSMRGQISSSSMYAVNNADGTEFLGSFTEDNITGTFEHWECLLLCFG